MAWISAQLADQKKCILTHKEWVQGIPLKKTDMFAGEKHAPSCPSTEQRGLANAQSDCNTNGKVSYQGIRRSHKKSNGLPHPRGAHTLLYLSDHGRNSTAIREDRIQRSDLADVL